MAVKKATKKVEKIGVTLEDLLEAGAHFGHEARRWNPKMAPYIYASRDGIHIFDLAKTREGLLEAFDAVRDAAKEGKTILFVGTKRQARDIVRGAAERVGMPYLTTRWPGGAITNFEQIKKSLRKLVEMKEAREEGRYKNRTKRERLLIDREIASLERIFGGIANLTELPEMLFVVGTHEEKTAVSEANKKGIPVVGIVDTNADPDVVEYQIPANDDATRSISIIVDFITKGIEEGLKEGKKKEDKSDKS